MRILSLDPIEHKIPSAEESSTLALSPKEHFEDLNKFFFATVASDYFPKDERWYSKKEINEEEKKKVLKELMKSSEEIGKEVTEGLNPTVILYDDWDEIDFLFETEARFGRFHWITTA